MSKTTYNIHDCKEPKCNSRLKEWLIMKWMRWQEIIHGEDYWLDE